MNLFKPIYASGTVVRWYHWPLILTVVPLALLLWVVVLTFVTLADLFHNIENLEKVP